MRISRNGTIIGTWTEEEVRKKIRTGSLLLSDQYSPDGSVEFLPLAMLAEVTAGPVGPKNYSSLNIREYYAAKRNRFSLIALILLAAGITGVFFNSWFYIAVGGGAYFALRAWVYGIRGLNQQLPCGE